MISLYPDMVGSLDQNPVTAASIRNNAVSNTQITAVPQSGQKKCWLDRVALPQGRDEKTTNQANTVQIQCPAPNLQSYSAAHSLENRPSYWCRGQVPHDHALESRREPSLRSTDP